MLEADLHKRLRDFPFDLNIGVNGGEILILLGENGAGKSTALNILAGLLIPDTGSVRLNGRTLCDTGQGICLSPEQREIGYVLQNSAAFPHLSVADNIAYGMRARHVPENRIEEEVAYWLEMLDIRSLATVKARDLSGGQRQRVAIGRALATKPDLLMLDEPFTALDRDGVAIVRRLVRHFVTDNQIPCIIVTHRIMDSTGIADKACLITRGRAQWTGMPDRLPEDFTGIPENSSRNAR